MLSFQVLQTKCATDHKINAYGLLNIYFCFSIILLNKAFFDLIKKKQSQSANDLKA